MFRAYYVPPSKATTIALSFTDTETVSFSRLTKPYGIEWLSLEPDLVRTTIGTNKVLLEEQACPFNHQNQHWERIRLATALSNFWRKARRLNPLCMKNTDAFSHHALFWYPATMTELLLAPKQGSISHFVVSTIPLLGILLYFLYEAWSRPNEAQYQLGDDFTDDQVMAANDATGAVIRLFDILIVFLVFHFLWTLFAIYIVVFVPKRRHLIGRYLSEGHEVIGDVIYDKNSRTCTKFQDYGFAVYPHPTEKTLIRKRVRVYQPYTRERITILCLPNKPLSGQAKIDIEIDLNAASKERDNQNRQFAAFATFWYFFTLAGSYYVVHQMGKLNDGSGNASVAMKVFLVSVGLNIPICYASNLIRFLMSRNWITNRGAKIDGSDDPRKMQPGCLFDAESVDGSDVIPYSIMNEEDMSYQGSIPSHDVDPQKSATAEGKKAWVTL
eukprot:scaffold1736_cov127-Cylindrotheca_fusiformis.AAC.75